MGFFRVFFSFIYQTRDIICTWPVFINFVLWNNSTLSDIIHVNGAARFRHHLIQNSRTIVPSASPIDVYSPSLHQPGFRWKNKNWRDTLCSLNNSRDLEYTFWGFPLWICPMCIIHQTCRCASNYRRAYVILNFVEITGNLNQLLLFHN